MAGCVIIINQTENLKQNLKKILNTLNDHLKLIGKFFW